MRIYQLLKDKQLVGFKFGLLKIIKMYTVGSQEVLCCAQVVSILVVLCSLFSGSSQHETCFDAMIAKNMLRMLIYFSEPN